MKHHYNKEANQLISYLGNMELAENIPFYIKKIIKEENLKVMVIQLHFWMICFAFSLIV